MIPFLQNKSKHKHITVDSLRADKTATEVGWWKKEAIINGSRHKFYISRRDGFNEAYDIVHSSPFKIIATRSTLDEAAQFLDNFIASAKTHDISMLLDHQNKARIVIGR